MAQGSTTQGSTTHGSTIGAVAPTVARRSGAAFSEMLKDSALFALVTLGLSIPVVAYRTDLGQGTGLELTGRWGVVAGLCLAVFVLRLGQRLLLGEVARRREVHRLATLDAAPVVARAGRVLGPLTLFVALTLPLLAALASGGLSEGRYWIDLGILILTYVMLGWGLNIVVGLAGLLDLGYVAFYAVGAYSYALLSTVFGLSFWICLPLAGLFAAAFGVLLGFPVLRLRGDYLAIVTLAFGEIIRLVLIKWTDVTGGAAGTLIKLQMSAANFQFSSRAIYFWIILTLVTAAMVMMRGIERGRFGAYLIAVRENENAAAALGVDTLMVKLKAITLSAGLTALAGAFYVQYFLFVDSSIAFGSWISVEALLAPIVGGLGTVFGPLLGALALHFLGELAKAFAGRIPGIDLALFGVLLVLVVAFARHGIQGLLTRLMQRIGARRAA